MDSFQKEKIFRLLSSCGIKRASIIIEEEQFEFANTTTANKNEYLFYSSGNKQERFNTDGINECPCCKGKVVVVGIDESIKDHIVEDLLCTSCGKESSRWFLSKVYLGTIKNAINVIPNLIR